MKTKLFIALSLFVTQFTFAQWEEVGTPIQGEFSTAFFGKSVTLSSNGNYMAVGQPSRGTVSNADQPSPVVIYERDGENWVEIHRIDAPIDPDERYGESLDFTPDGSRLVIGASVLEFDSTAPLGRVLVFDRQDDNSFIQVGEDILNPGTGSFFGEAVSISADGNTIAVGRPLVIPGLNEGEVHAFRFNGTAWEQIGQTLGGDINNDIFFGASVTLNIDGSLLAIGIQRGDETNFRGAMEIYQFDEGTSMWTQVGDRIEGETGSFLGDSVDMTPDGNTIVVGANRNNQPGPPPYVEVYQREGDSYVLKGNRIESELGFSGYGDSAGITDDGTIIAFGASLFGPNDSIDEEGSIMIYEFQGGDWVLRNQFFGESLFERLGESISISGNGGIVVAGGINYDPNNQQDSFGGVRTYTNDQLLSIASTNFTTEISVFPNPVIDSVNISFGENQNQVNTVLYDTLGREIATQSFSNQNELQLNTESLRTGVYILQVSNDEGNTATIRFVKQ